MSEKWGLMPWLLLAINRFLVQPGSVESMFVKESQLIVRASAAQESDEGLRLSRQWCTSCHIVEPGASGSDAARPFEAIANDTEFKGDGLRAWLADPHPPMLNLNLNRAETEAIIGYLLSLRRAAE